jgi:nucleotide-binding universal stress UspA family protein
MTASHSSLVVGHDGSPGAAHALAFAADLAESIAAPLHVVRSWGIDPDPSVALLLLDESRTRDEVTAALKHALVADCEPVAHAHPALQISYEATPGPAEIVLCASSKDKRMLVLGARGHGGLTGLLLGSVSDRSLHLSTRPVMIVPPVDRRAAKAPARAQLPTDFEDAGAIPALAPGTVLVAYDGSDHADAALGEALRLAHELSAPVAVVQAWTFETAPAGAIWKDGAVSPLPDIASDVRAALESRVSAHSRQHPTVAVGCHAILGQATEVLVQLSEAASVLVVGSRGLGGFRGLMLGSVSLHCAHRALCPVLVVPSAGQDSADRDDD